MLQSCLLAGSLHKGEEMEDVVLLEGGHCRSYSGAGSTPLSEVRELLKQLLQRRLGSAVCTCWWTQGEELCETGLPDQCPLAQVKPAVASAGAATIVGWLMWLEKPACGMKTGTVPSSVGAAVSLKTYIFPSPTTSCENTISKTLPSFGMCWSSLLGLWFVQGL